MNYGDLTLAYAMLRGGITAKDAFRDWARGKTLTPHDERLLRAADIFADAAKEWVRSKAEEVAAAAKGN